MILLFFWETPLITSIENPENHIKDEFRDFLDWQRNHRIKPKNYFREFLNSMIKTKKFSDFTLVMFYNIRNKKRKNRVLLKADIF